MTPDSVMGRKSQQIGYLIDLVKRTIIHQMQPQKV